MRQEANAAALGELLQFEVLAGIEPDGKAPVSQRLTALTTRQSALEAAASAQVELAGSLIQARRNLRQAGEALDRAAMEQKAWQQQWSAVLTRAGLPPDTSLAAARTALSLFSEADSEARTLRAAERRLTTMAADEAAFVGAVQEVANAVGSTLPIEDPIGISRNLEGRLQRAQQHCEQRRKLTGDHATRQASVLKLDEAMAAHEARARLLRETAGVATEEELDQAVLRTRQYDELVRLQTGLRQRLRVDGGDRSEVSLRAEADGIEEARLQERQHQAAMRLAELDDAIVVAVGKQTEAQQRRQILEQRTGAAAAAQEVAQRLAELGEVAGQWAQLRATSLLLGAAIERYRKRQSDPLLATASHYLRRLTGAACTGFDVDFDERDEPRLVVQRPSGKTLPVTGLSEGTRDQLWLALRLAAIERHVEAAEPLPFIGDDVFVNFDDERATAGLEALADLGARCQVLLFTHHPHLVELGRTALGSRLAVVELSA